MGPGYGCHFYVNFPWNGYLYANLVDSSGGNHMIYSSSSVVPYNAFTHVAVTYDKASGIACLYANGAAAGSADLGNFPLQTATDVYLGYRPNGSPGGPIAINGLIDEPTVYNRALSQTEILAIYNAGHGGKCPPSTDADQDALPDWWEYEWLGNLSYGSSDDPNHDGLNNLQEFLLGTNPNVSPQPDSNGVIGMEVFTPLQ